MTRMSAASIKRRRGSYIQDRPREGTKLRACYDKAMTGQWFTLDGQNKSNVINLRTWYELEIISERDPASLSRTKPTYRYKCVGVWVGADLRSLEDVEVALENSVLRDPEGVQDGLR